MSCCPFEWKSFRIQVCTRSRERAQQKEKMIEKQKSFENSTRNGPERNSSSAIAPISTSLPDSVLEKLLSSYSLKQKRSALVVFLAASILFDLWAIFVPQGQSTENLGKLTRDMPIKLYTWHTFTSFIEWKLCFSCRWTVLTFAEATTSLFHTYFYT